MSALHTNRLNLEMKDQDPSQISTSQINTLVAPYILEQMGFQTASQSFLPQVCRKIFPKGQHLCFRDALYEGCSLLTELSKTLQQTGTSQHWRMLHILIVDHSDTSSKTPLSQLLRTMSALPKLVQAQSVKTIIIGVDLPTQTEQELEKIAHAAGKDTAEYVGVSKLDRFAQRTVVMGGLQARKKAMATFLKNSPTTAASSSPESELPHYAVLLSLSGRESMAGQKWAVACAGLDKIMEYLSDTDIVAGLIFEKTVKSISKLSMRDSFFGEDYEDSVSLSSEVKSNLPVGEIVRSKSASRMKVEEKSSGKHGSGCSCAVM